MRHGETFILNLLVTVDQQVQIQRTFTPMPQTYPTCFHYAAVPYGAALIWLGYSLWTDRQATSTATSLGSSTAARTSAAIR